MNKKFNQCSTEFAQVKTQSPHTRQPRSVWAIAFAAMVSFMGVGLVDPILPEISKMLHASPTQAILLFTSYLFLTAIIMFFSAWASSLLGIKRTLLIGLGIVVVFAGACALASGINQVLIFRAGWGIGNALFISTALGAIVSSVTGSTARAIMLYEAALGIGLAFGPLLGGMLGAISWRGPFAGTAILMAIAWIAIISLLKKQNTPTQKQGFLSGIKALSNPTLRTLSLCAICYNFAFFIVLAYSPFPLEAAGKLAGFKFGALQLGLVFFGWGIGLAITSVLVAPIMTRSLGLLPTLHIALGGLALLGLLAAFHHQHLYALTTIIILSGLFMGIMNTALTETVMDSVKLPRGVASSAYSGVRFLGGALAPALAGPIAKTWGAETPYYVAGAAFLVAMFMLFLGRKHLLAEVEYRPHLSHDDEGTAIATGEY